MRVKVWDGSGDKLLGEGEYEGDVKVYFFTNDDGSISSNKNAEEKPEGIPEDKLIQWFCPKIVLDSGEVVYGCQVWWEYV